MGEIILSKFYHWEKIVGKDYTRNGNISDSGEGYDTLKGEITCSGKYLILENTCTKKAYGRITL